MRAVERASFDLPRMYADHHVETVRTALLQLAGVEEVFASSAAKRAVITYDATRLKPGAIEDALRAAGFAPGDEPPLPKVPEGKEDDSAWFTSIQRITRTNMKDLEMSGDFRKY
jgi:copper chaperone CopZ